MKSFPVGYYNFSKDEALNFQLNRFYSSGSLSYEELMDIGAKVRSFEEWIACFTELGADAEENGEFLKAAQSYRAAQFYTLGETKYRSGTPMKKVLYEKCRENYDRAFREKEGLVYERIPFQSGYLPVYHMTPQKSHGTIVIHGGYDSFVQEFMQFLFYFYEKGYAVYFFEGPGQGEVLHTPYEYFNHIRRYNTREISKLISQDTLVLAGEHDIYTVYFQQQLDALTNAKSVTGRIFTEAESADHHCQIGNLGLVLDTMEEWISLHSRTRGDTSQR